MNDAEVARAVEAVRAIVAAPADAESVWRHVTRLDGRPPYLLVGISAGRAGWVGAVSYDGEVRGWAADEEGARAWWTHGTDELVWAPGSWSRSPLYPLRRTTDGRLLDHRGEPVREGPLAPG
jgi:hypothetical protein